MRGPPPLTVLRRAIHTLRIREEVIALAQLCNKSSFSCKMFHLPIRATSCIMLNHGTQVMSCRYQCFEYDRTGRQVLELG